MVVGWHCGVTPGSESQDGQYSGQVPWVATPATSHTGAPLWPQFTLRDENLKKYFLTESERDRESERMRRPRYEEESVAKRWEDLKDYEKQLEERESSSAGSEPAESGQPSSAKTNMERLKQLKCGANKKFSSFKSQLSDICRWDS